MKKIGRVISAFAFIVVIDAGHGGNDNGAVSPNGLKEKDVSLNIALSLKERLSKENDISVVLTRDNDVNLTLEQRAITANQAKGDLFISIHSNFSPAKEKSGIELFYYNRSFSNKINFNVPIAWDNVQLKFTKPSKILAENIIKAITNDGELRQFVSLEPKVSSILPLKWTAMPAVAVEVGYLSNANDEQLILDKKDSIVEALAQGILNSKKK